MATASNDMTKMMRDMLGAFPVDARFFQDAFRTSATFSEKMSKVALDAAGKSTEISTRWTRDALSKLDDVTTVKEEPADCGKAMTEFASSQVVMATEYMAAFAEVAKKVQMEAVELMLAAGKDLGEDATGAAKEAATGMSSATRNATPAGTPPTATAV